MVRHVAARRVPVVLLVCVVAVLLSRASSRGESAMGMARGWGRRVQGPGGRRGTFLSGLPNPNPNPNPHSLLLVPGIQNLPSHYRTVTKVPSRASSADAGRARGAC